MLSLDKKLLAGYILSEYRQMRRVKARVIIMIRSLIILMALIVTIFSADISRAQFVFDTKIEVISAGEKRIGSARLTADPWGTIHVAYPAWLGDEPLFDDGKVHLNTVMYTYNQNGKWTSPVDILVPPNPGEEGVFVNTVLVNPRSQQLFILWRSDTGLYLSSAFVDGARSAQTWQTQMLSADTSYWGSLALNPIDNVMHIIYDSNFKDIYHIFSADNGHSWSAPELVASVPSGQVAFAGSRLVIDSHGFLHAVWEEEAAYRNWNSDAVWYARSVNNGGNWTITEVARSAPDQKSTGGINVGFGKGDEVFLVWNRGAGSEDGRYYRRSLDSGATWSDAREIWPGTPTLKGGQAGWSFPLLDGDSNLYLVTSIEDDQAAAEGVSNSLRFAKWTGQDWGPSIYLTTCEFPDATVSRGNLLHIVCPTFDRSERIKYIRIETDAKPVQPLPKPTILATPMLDTNKNFNSRNAQQSSKIYNIEEESSITEHLMFDRQQPMYITTVITLFLSVAGSLVIIVGVVLWNLRKR
jgi:hypothetical protein